VSNYNLSVLVDAFSAKLRVSCIFFPRVGVTVYKHEMTSPGRGVNRTGKKVRIRLDPDPQRWLKQTGELKYVVRVGLVQLAANCLVEVIIYL
jgi:hypothetical protein